MAPHKPLRYAGPDAPQEQLSSALQSAKPDWTARELATATSKLASIGIESIDELARALAEGLNTRIRQAGLKTFGSETITELRKVIETQYSALVSQNSLQDIKERKQSAIAVGDYLEALTLRKHEQELIEQIDGLGLSEISCRGGLDVLEKELLSLRALKTAAAKAENFLGADRVKQEERRLLDKINTLKAPSERTRAELRALKAEHANTEAELQAAVQAEDYQHAHETQQRVKELSERLDGLRALQQDSDPEEARLQALDGAEPQSHGQVKSGAGSHAEDTDGAGDARQRPREGGKKNRYAMSRRREKHDTTPLDDGLCRAVSVQPAMQARALAHELERELCEEDQVPILRNNVEGDQAVGCLERFPRAHGSANAGGGGSSSSSSSRSSSSGRSDVLDEEQAAATAASPRVWEILGGKRGSLLVREAQDRGSKALQERLSQGARVQEIELVGHRLHYRMIRGEGPDEGWITCQEKGKAQACLVSGQERAALNFGVTPERSAHPQSHQASVPAPPRARTGAGMLNAAPTSPAAELGRMEAPPPEVQLLPAACSGSTTQAARSPPQVDAALRERAEMEGIHIDHLERPERAEELLEKVEKLGKTTASKLKKECRCLGIPADENESRADLQARVRDAYLWQEMSFDGLREFCRERGLILDDGVQKADILQFLKNHTWEMLGVPFSRLPGLAEATSLLQSLRALEDYSSQELAAKSGSLGLPVASPFEMRANLRRVLIWNELPTEELRRECVLYSAPLSARQAGTDEAEKQELMFRLREVIARGDVLRARGIPFERLGLESANDVLAQLERWQDLSDLSLRVQSSRQGWGSRPELHGEALLDALRDALVWRHLPWAELLRDCVEYDVPSTGLRDHIISRLLTQREVTSAWRAQGIPPALFQDRETVEELSEQLERIDGMPEAELRQWYEEDMQCPPEKDLGRGELLELCKQYTVLVYLPLEELIQQCDERHVAADGPENSDTRRQVLVDCLFEQDVMTAWEKRGFEAHRIGDFQTLVAMVSRYEEFASMSDAELKRELSEVVSFEGGMDRQGRLQRLKKVLVWENLPLDELSKECLDYGIEPETMENESSTRSKWIQQLSMALLKQSYEQKNFPVGNLSKEQVYSLAVQCERLESLSVAELRAQSDELIPLPHGAPKEELVRSLQDWTILLALPYADLVAEGHKLGVPTVGFELPVAASASTVLSPPQESAEAAAENELHIRLQARIFLRKRFLAKKEAEQHLPLLMPGVTEPVAHGRDQERRVEVRRLPEVWKYIQHMRDPFMAEVVCSVPGAELPDDFALPPVAKSWPPLDTALHVLSGGIFDSREHRPRNDSGSVHGQEGKLISVICPTNDKRRMWHNLLYECFKGQTYEPKELVIVDTGAMPSAYFEDVAKDDPAVVYRFFPVKDATTPRSTSESSQAKSKVHWSLGLKRNIACCLARGAVIAQFDDDDLYFPDYLQWFWNEITEVARRDDGGLNPVLAKLSQWHLFDLSNMAFHYMDPLLRKCLPLNEQPAALYGWGFSYVFTRRAWELAPFPDVHFAEDAGFVEGLLSQGVPVSLLEVPGDRTLVAHTVHPASTTGGEVSVGRRGCDNPVPTPDEFEGHILQHLARQVHNKAKTRRMFASPLGAEKGAAESSVLQRRAVPDRGHEMTSSSIGTLRRRS